MVLEAVVNNMELYVRFVERFFSENNRTTPIQIESIVIIYKLTGSQRAFEILYKSHSFLLIKIVRATFNKYNTYLYDEDYVDLLCMSNEEFFRRTLFFKIPAEAPFSGYISLYMKKWLNVYCKLIVKRNRSHILECDNYSAEKVNDQLTQCDGDGEL